MGFLKIFKGRKSSKGSKPQPLRNDEESEQVNSSPEPISTFIPPKPENQKVSDELLPIVTLMNHQQLREYYIGNIEYSDNSEGLNSDWIMTQVSLKGSNLTISDIVKPIYINICDCELNVLLDQLIVQVFITDVSQVLFRFADEQQLVDFYSSILLSKFEYTQLQEAYTGGLLSSEAIHFSDIRTLLDPNNRRHSKEEWCVLRFPYLNGKWIRCLVVIKTNKIEIYLNSNKSKKNLLATILDGKSVHGVYSGHVSTIKENSLVRVWGDCYIDTVLLNKLLSNDDLGINGSASNKSIRRNSITKGLSIGSLRSSKSHESLTSSSNTSIRKTHRRIQSIDTQVSENSFNSKTPKKLEKRDIVKTHLVYVIPESHGGIKPVEIMLRMVIPMMNTFELYGRPQKFVSSRNEKESLLFGLPQLPNTIYLTSESARDLVAMNLANSIRESWVIFDWNMVFKEMMSVMLEKGWTGGVANVKYEKPIATDIYDPDLDFNEE